MVHSRLTGERYLCDDPFHDQPCWPQASATGGELTIAYNGGETLNHDEAALRAADCEVRA
ncbi:hypothetical protein GOB94_13880 [Granulicella sp. 5B5]|uniref:hypothetical protein n=1 Tax=Granulicella sp. 5B5 TaxID=1617967 RepID=UPI0015F5C8F6|nr:hypothetical protein [Granulicella sp. 5B5]QMV19657.1 hypothetical protein GOB94_13880 [Granulicella sp. 5B5]